MSGCALYIEEHEDDASPCACGNCEWRGPFAQLGPADDGVLTPGDPSFAGRCPECDSVAYLDRPEDRAADAGRHLVWTLKQGYPTGDANLHSAIERLQSALAEVRPEFAFTINVATRGQV